MTSLRMPLLGVCVAAALACLCVCASPLLAAPHVLYAQNPFLTGRDGLVAADPDVMRVDQPDGSVMFVLTHTQKNSGGSDFPLYVSLDLVNWQYHGQALNLTLPDYPEESVQIGKYHYCGMWAPEIRPLASSPGWFALSFTASRFKKFQSHCPDYDEGSGVFMAYANNPLGPFNVPEDGGVPIAVGPRTDDEEEGEDRCPREIADTLPYSHQVNKADCGSRYCNNTIRLDGDLFNDPQTGESWFAYSWYTNREPQLFPWEQENLGEHISLVRVEKSDPRTVPCDAEKATKVWAFSPHDDETTAQLAASCPRCGEMLSFTRGRQNEEVTRGPTDASWGVTEGPMLFRRGGYVYLIAAHSLWDSAYYSAAWVAAPTVEELDISNGPSPNRIVGRLLIPSKDQSFGHGTAVLGPDNKHWYYIHHHLDHSRSHCWESSDVCARDIYISPIDFEDRGDGLGEVYIKEHFPAEVPGLRVGVVQPGSVPDNDDEEDDRSDLARMALISFLVALALLLLAAAGWALYRSRQPQPLSGGRDVRHHGYVVGSAGSMNRGGSIDHADAALLQHQYHSTAVASGGAYEPPSVSRAV